MVSEMSTIMSTIVKGMRATSRGTKILEITASICANRRSIRLVVNPRLKYKRELQCKFLIWIARKTYKNKTLAKNKLKSMKQVRRRNRNRGVVVVIALLAKTQQDT